MAKVVFHNVELEEPQRGIEEALAVSVDGELVEGQKLDRVLQLLNYDSEVNALIGRKLDER